MKKIPIILGTAREGRQSEHVAHFVEQELRKRKDVDTEIVDPRDLASAATIPA